MSTLIAPFVIWNNSWLIGVREIDAQHKNLVLIVNQLHEAMTRGQGKDVLGAILASLITNSKAHFTTEERLMQQSGYPDLAAHKNEHERMMAKVLDFQRKFESGGVGIGFEVIQCLSSWLEDHVRGTDRRYVPFLHTNGVIRAGL